MQEHGITDQTPQHAASGQVLYRLFTRKSIKY